MGTFVLEGTGTMADIQESTITGQDGSYQQAQVKVSDSFSLKAYADLVADNNEVIDPCARAQTYLRAIASALPDNARRSFYWICATSKTGIGPREPGSASCSSSP